MTKKKTALLALVLVAIFAVGFSAGWYLAPTQIYVTVEEAITIVPEFISITMHPSETEIAEFTITNVASNPITLTIDVLCLNETYAGFFELVYESSFTAEPGTNLFTVSITASPSTPIVEGLYVFEVAYER